MSRESENVFFKVTFSVNAWCVGKGPHKALKGLIYEALRGPYGIIRPLSAS